MKKLDHMYATPFGELNGFLVLCSKVKKKIKACYEARTTPGTALKKDPSQNRIK